MQQIEISFNGEPASVPSGATLATLIERGGYDTQYVAVVVNETFVPAPEQASRALQPGDRVEILMPFAGG